MHLLAPYCVTFLVQTSFGYELRKVPCPAQKSAYNNPEIEILNSL